MRWAWLICLKDVRQRLRDRTAVGVGVVAPLILTALIGFALRDSEGFRMRLAIVESAASARTASFAEFLERPDLRAVITVSRVGSSEDALVAVSEKRVEVAVRLPPDAGPEIFAAGDNPFATRMTRALIEDWLQRGSGAPAAAPVVVARSPGGSLRMIDYFGPSMAVLFLTFSILSGVRALQSELEDGTLARLRATPCQPVAIYAGKFGALLIIGLVQMSVMIGATSLLFGTRWGDPVLVACLALGSVLMAIGLAAFFVSLARDADRAQGLASISIFLLAALGGQFLPPQGLPDVFETLNRLTPNGQAFRGFVDLAAAGGAAGLPTVLEPLAVTVGVGLAGIGFAAWRARDALAESV